MRARAVRIGFVSQLPRSPLGHIGGELFTFFLLFCICSSRASDSPAILAELVAEIDAKEKLYCNLEVAMHVLTQYEGAEHKGVKPQRYSCEWRHSIVCGNRFFVCSDQLVNSDQSTSPNYENRKVGFDGTTGWTVTNSGMAILGDDPPAHECLTDPHTFFLCRRWSQPSLSKTLQSHVMRYHGNEVVEGISCELVSFSSAGRLVQLWIAPSRNYMPIRMDVVGTEEKNRVSWGIVSNWVEIDAGVWFPTYARITEQAPLVRIATTTEYFIDKVILDSQRMVGLPPIVNGTTVDVYRKGMQLQRYVHGKMVAPATPWPTWLRMLVINDVLVLVIMVSWLGPMLFRRAVQNTTRHPIPGVKSK